MSAITNAANETTEVQSGQRRGLLLQAGDGARYLVPTGVLEACRVDEAQLAALGVQDDVTGYWYELATIAYVNYLWDESTYLAGRAWNAFTFTIAGSNAKFEYTPEGRSATGVRG
jgi:hypothetical protein